MITQNGLVKVQSKNWENWFSQMHPSNWGKWNGYKNSDSSGGDKYVTDLQIAASREKNKTWRREKRFQPLRRKHKQRRDSSSFCVFKSSRGFTARNDSGEIGLKLQHEGWWRANGLVQRFPVRLDDRNFIKSWLLLGKLHFQIFLIFGGEEFLRIKTLRRSSFHSR